MPGGAGVPYLVWNALNVPLDQWKRRGRQALAGAHENITANVAGKDSISPYKPAVISQVAGIPAVVKSLTSSGQANRKKGGAPFSGDTAVEKFLNQSYHEMDVAEAAGNKLAGTTSAENLDDLIFRHGILGLLNPASAAKTGLKVAPKVAKLAAKGAKIAAKVPKPIRVQPMLLTK